MEAEPTLRVISPDEAPEVIKLMRKIGWDHPLEQTRQNIMWGGQGSFCLAYDERIVATAICLKYSQRLAWIGLVISDPEYQRRGFARRLMNHAMEYLSDVDSVMLDASTAGFPVYDKMGYQSLYKIHVYTGESQGFTPSSSIRRMMADDLPTIVDMDCKIMGLPRQQVLNWLFETSEAYVATGSGKITGYTFTRPLDPLRLVAWNAQDAATAESLLQFGSNLAAESGRGLHVSIPETNETARSMVERHGLTIDRSVTRMVYGKQPPGRMTEQYGIVAFMTG
jgi:GNAT superfamily N-acetyltransferase